MGPIVSQKMHVTLRIGGVSYDLRLVPNSSHPLQAWQATRLVDAKLMRSQHPWAIILANVDGLCDHDLVVGIREKTRYLNFEHNTLFVMHFDGKQFARKWAGSSLGKPFTEFAFAPARKGKGQLLVTIDEWIQGQRAVTAHEWNGFGFRVVGRPKVLAEAVGLEVSNNMITVKQREKRVTFPLQEIQ